MVVGAGSIRVVYPHITAAGRSKDNTSTTEGSSDSKAVLGGICYLSTLARAGVP